MQDVDMIVESHSVHHRDAQGKPVVMVTLRSDEAGGLDSWHRYMSQTEAEEFPLDKVFTLTLTAK